jgi:cephalosporin hydroxylase
VFPFWDIAIVPVLKAIDAKRVVEIGALRGETTTLLLEELLDPEAELHVIDPVPQFDPTEHERRFPGRYIFHRDISHNALPRLSPADVALVDGDHNWYTVYHDLRLLSATAREAGAPLPVFILHDVGWPYGRRDLYYTPEQIPEEFRQPYDQRGMVPGRAQLLRAGRGGMNPTMNNAVREGGARNGVMTALDDFIEEHDKPVRRVVLPIYFGLAIVAEEERLARQPELARVLDRLETAEGRYELLELSESLRIKAMIFQHGVFYKSLERIAEGARRYLSLLKGALLDEHYLEHEARLDYLAQCIERGQSPDQDRLRDPARHMQKEMRALAAARNVGSIVSDAGEAPPGIAYTTMGRERLDHLERCLDTIRGELVKGDLVECGSSRGGGAIFLRAYLEAFEMQNRAVWVADPFRAAPTPGGEKDSATARQFNLKGDLNIVRDAFARFDLLDERVRFLQGSFASTLPDAPIEKVALLRIDASAAQAAHEALETLYDKIPLGGFVIVDSYGSPASRQAIEEFRARRGVDEELERVNWGSVAWRKMHHAAPGSPEAQGGRDRAPLAKALPSAHRDLSIVVVFYNMRREAERTLHSLSRAYQRGIEGLDYEVIVVENGSADDQKLGEEFVREFGPKFRYLDLGSEATPSPTNALNRGIEVATGEVIALMIDGAHVLTPGVLRFAKLGLEGYAPAVVVTQQWYVGPGQQPDAMQAGYDSQYEDRLFEEIEWPVDGYRLFEIGHFVSDRDWFEGLSESNCIFVPRSILEQAGCMDESFSMPGGGFANLDFYERVCATAGATVVTILGEGSFHQVHGGTTTNQPKLDERHLRISSYREHYKTTRGRNFRGHGKPVHYVGWLPIPARRTRPRRMVAPAFFKAAQARRNGGYPDKPMQIPEELTAEFTDMFWRSLAWQETTWLGRRVVNCPTDLLAYQDLIAKVKPDWVIETRTGAGGRAMFLATICELLGHGQVLSIQERAAGKLPEHPRVRYVTGHSVDEDTVRQVRDIVGDPSNALVILGSRGGRERMVQEFEAYAPLVPVGSYIVMENTIVNGNPVLPEFGPGPAEAVRKILRLRSDFAPDRGVEKYALTFNPGGFLKRLN